MFPVLFIGPHEPGAIELAQEAIERGIAAFKIICGDHYCYDDETMAFLHVIRAVDQYVSTPASCGTASLPAILTVLATGNICCMYRGCASLQGIAAGPG